MVQVCAIASRFYTTRPELHAKLSDLSRKLAFNVPAQGYKSVEIVQAYLLNTLWGCGPVERYEQDRTWMLLGMAIRLVYVPCLFRLLGVHLEGRVPRHDATKSLTNVLCLTR